MKQGIFRRQAKPVILEAIQVREDNYEEVCRFYNGCQEGEFHEMILPKIINPWTKQYLGVKADNSFGMQRVLIGGYLCRTKPGAMLTPISAAMYKRYYDYVGPKHHNATGSITPSKVDTNFELGEVVAWDYDGRTVVSAMRGDNDFNDWMQVSLHFKGDSNVDADDMDLWWGDSILDYAKKWRKATKDEVLELVWALVEHHEVFTTTPNGGLVLGDFVQDPEIATEETQRWRQYLKELVATYQVKHTLSGISDLSRKFHVGGVSKELFFQLGLDKIDSDDIDNATAIKILNKVKEERK